MNIKLAKLSVVVFLGAVFMLAFLISNRATGKPANGQISTGMADPAKLLRLYEAWKEEYEKNGGDRNLVLPLGPSVLSTEAIKASGSTRLNMIDGKVSVEVGGLPEAGEGWDFWLVQVQPDRPVVPEKGDDMINVGTLKTQGKIAKLDALLGSDTFARFRPQLAIVTRFGKRPDESRILVGMTDLFSALYRSEQLGHLGALEAEAARQDPQAEQPGLLTRLLAAMVPSAEAQGPPPGITADVAAGRDLFLNGQFNGNGRTCASCHRENDNFTIDPNFIATLPPTDFLFVAEFNPDLSKGFEDPPVMHAVGDILENHDGFLKPGVLRGVPHTLALPLSINPQPQVAAFFTHALGWSADGSPTGPVDRGDGSVINTTGSLNDFAIGAVRQHFTKTLNRRAGVDFTFPTPTQLNQLEAFQRSLGRNFELQLDPTQPGALILNGTLANFGQQRFQATFGVRSCNGCHHNAGANIAAGTNNNFNTHVEDLPDQPARQIDPNIPTDDGFQAVPTLVNTFNTPPLVEAAFTPPFFHNNSISTVELAVQFYEFGFSGQFPDAPRSFQPDQGFTPTTVQAIAAFLRVIGALEKIRSATNLENRAEDPTATNAQAIELLQLAEAEVNHSIGVLTPASLHPVAVQDLQQAISDIEQAINAPDVTTRNRFIEQAKTAETNAKADMMVQGPF